MMTSFYDLLEAITEDTKRRIYEKITTVGISVKRGQKDFLKHPFSSDPGDFGRGIYYDTNYQRAKTYGNVEISVIKLKNPIVLTDEEAYNLSDKFRTVRLSNDDYEKIGKEIGFGPKKRIERLNAQTQQLLKNAQAMTDFLLSQGYDGLVSIHKNGLEVVDYRPYQTKTP